MTAKEAAEHLQMTVSALMRHVSNGNIPANRATYPMDFSNVLIHELAAIKQRVVTGELISVPGAAKKVGVSTTKIYKDIERLDVTITRLYGECGPALLDGKGLAMIRQAEKKCEVLSLIPEGYAPIKNVSKEIGRSMTYLYKKIDQGRLAVMKKTPERPFLLVNIEEARRLANADQQWQVVYTRPAESLMASS